MVKTLKKRNIRLELKMENLNIPIVKVDEETFEDFKLLLEYYKDKALYNNCSLPLYNAKSILCERNWLKTSWDDFYHIFILPREIEDILIDNLWILIVEE